MKTIPGTQALHYAVAASASDLQVQPISPFSGIRCDVKVVNIIELAQTTASSNDVSQLNEVSSVSSDADTAAAAIQDELVPDDYVVVMYDGKTYAGVIEEVVNDEYRVNVLHQCKGIYVMNDI